MQGREMQKNLKSYGLSQNAISACIGISAPMLSNILTEKVKPSHDTEWRLIRLLALCNEVELVIRKRLGGKK